MYIPSSVCNMYSPALSIEGREYMLYRICFMLMSGYDIKDREEVDYIIALSSHSKTIYDMMMYLDCCLSTCSVLVRSTMLIYDIYAL